MTHGEILARYVGSFVDALWDAGVEDVGLCPGSRSTPLALMIMRHERLKVWTHLDERSCAFFALGMAKANRRPLESPAARKGTTVGLPGSVSTVRKPGCTSAAGVS